MAVQTSTALEEGPLRISWSVPSGCPSASDVLARVRALLGGELVTVLRHPLDVGARVTQLEDGRYQLDLEMREGSDAGARRIEAATCSELGQVGALVIALTIDPALVERARAGAAETESPATAAPSAVTPPPPPPAEESPPRRERGAASAPGAADTRDSGRAGSGSSLRGWRFGPGLRLLGDAGSVPGVGLGGEFGVHASFRAWRLELDGVWLPSRRGSSAADPSVGGSIQLLALGARVCALAVREAMTGGLCAAMEVGRLHAESFGADIPGSGNMSWVSPGLGLSGRLRFAPRLALLARLEGLVPLHRSEFIVENVGEVYRPGPFVGRLALGVDVDF